MQLFTIAGSGLSTADVYFGVGSSMSCVLSNALTSVSFSAPPVNGAGTVATVSGTVTAGQAFRICVEPGGSSSTSGFVAGGQTIYAAAASDFSPHAVPGQANLSMTITGSGLPPGGVVSVKVPWCFVFVVNIFFLLSLYCVFEIFIDRCEWMLWYGQSTRSERGFCVCDQYCFDSECGWWHGICVLYMCVLLLLCQGPPSSLLGLRRLLL